MRLIPLPEGRGIDLDDGGLGQGVGTDQLVVRRVESDRDDTALAADTLTAPGEVAGLETQTAKLAVAAAGADEMDALGTDTCAGGLTALLEGPALGVRRRLEAEAIGLCDVPLLAVRCALSTSGAALVTGVTRDTAIMLASAQCHLMGSEELYRPYPMIALGEGYCSRPSQPTPVVLVLPTRPHPICSQRVIPIAFLHLVVGFCVVVNAARAWSTGQTSSTSNFSKVEKALGLACSKCRRGSNRVPVAKTSC